MSAAELLKSGDAPPFWDGLWHPEGKAEGAVMVKPRLYDGATMAQAPVGVPANAPATSPVATASVPAAAAEPVIAAPPPAEPVIQAAPPAAPAPAEPVIQAAPPIPEAAPQPQQPPQAPPQAPAAPRSLIVSLLAQGTVETAPTIPQPVDAARSEALRAKAKELQGQNQLGQALATIAESIKAAPGDPAAYAQMGHILMAGRALDDAAHHFLLAYMLAPKDPTYARMILHAAWALGYVGWAFQIAQALYKVQPAQDLVDLGKQAASWLQGGRPAAFTTLCTACRANSFAPSAGTCPKCGAAAMGGPANAAGFMGLRLLQQTPPTGRLFVGAACVSCYQETAVVVAKGGPCCLKCQEQALAPM